MRSDFDHSRFQMLLGMTQRELITYIRLTLNYTSAGAKFIYRKGSVPMCLVAHTDTVFIDYSKSAVLTGVQYKSSAGRGPLGADDRAGVLMALELAERYDCSVLFCADEETGGAGATEVVATLPMLETNLFIELDRKGMGTYVVYDAAEPEVAQYIQSFGLVETHGSFSDISILSPGLSIPAVNVSIGYYGQHTDHEILVVPAYVYQRCRVDEMLSRPIGKKYKLVPSYYDDYGDYGVWSGASSFLKDRVSVTGLEENRCGWCYGDTYDELKITNDYDSFVMVPMCDTCLDTLLNDYLDHFVCLTCGEPLFLCICTDRECEVALPVASAQAIGATMYLSRTLLRRVDALNVRETVTIKKVPAKGAVAKKASVKGAATKKVSAKGAAAKEVNDA